ncbi:MAG: type 4a pilus biogenesis protein PilO [candidate division Zixibacteria bacterium]|nr:type 4a pilus biogenesis protein PilO [candidate division Zixibacteria bacterium]
MDLKDSKIQKIALGVIAFFIVVYFWYGRVYSRYDSQISQKAQEFETITTNLRNVEMKAKSLEALKLEYTDLIERYNEIEALLPEVKQIPSFLVQLHMASSLTGTKITKLIPSEVSSNEFYNIAQFEVELSGGFHNFGRFISYVANFPFITNVMDMKIESLEVTKTKKSAEENKKLASDKKEDVMKSSFRLTTYFVKDSERLKEVTL